MYTEIDPNMRPYGGVKKVSQKGVGQKYIGYVHALQG